MKTYTLNLYFYMSKLMKSWWGGHLKKVQSELMWDAAWGCFMKSSVIRYQTTQQLHTKMNIKVSWPGPCRLA